MLPILLAVGPVVIKTFNVVMLIGLLVATFVFWRKGKEEHYEDDQLLDVFLVALAVGVLAARIGFIVTHWSGINPWSWFNLIGHPGWSTTWGGVAAGWLVYNRARKNKWDAFEILDFWVLAATLLAAFFWLGSFFNGTGFGSPTTLPWGVVFPGVFVKHHPIQIYAAIGYLSLFVFLSRLELRYRTFDWYKAKRKSAQTGFLVSVFLLAHGLLTFALLLVSPAQWVLSGVRLDLVAAGGWIVAGSLLLYIRSGRQLLPPRNRAK